MTATLGKFQPGFIAKNLSTMNWFVALDSRALQTLKLDSVAVLFRVTPARPDEVKTLGSLLPKSFQALAELPDDRLRIFYSLIPRPNS